MAINDFQGQVRISDVQSAFDEMVNNINGLVDVYNNADGYSDIDFTKGSPKLSASGYTLTVGGLKQVLANYNNTLIGCKVFKIDNLSCLVSEGLYITSDKVYRIPSQYVVGEAGWDLSELYYDTENKLVMFKDGSHGAIITEQSVFSQPEINSNTEYGIFTASSNSGNAYKITTNEGFSVAWQGTGTFAYPTVKWDLPKSVKINRISLDSNARVILGSSNIIIKCDEEIVYNGNSGHIEVNLNSRETSSITVYAQISNENWGFNISFSNLLLTGTSSTIAIEESGVITPSDSIIKICGLNWRAKDGLIRDIKCLQLDNPTGYSLRTQDRTYERYSTDSLNTNSSGKFVSYSGMMSTGSHNSSVSVLGANIIYNPENGDPHRAHHVAFPTSIVYIPKGSSDNMQASGYAGRTVYNPIFEKKED